MNWEKIGLKMGLEIHQQLNTEHKLFCPCSCNLIDKDNDYEIRRNLRPTQSELGDIDRAAFEEARRKLNFIYQGYNQVVFLHPGEFYIAYNARWYTFTSTQDDKQDIDVPTDILDCIPSYIAAQCFKIDDEYKASVFRNEYEMFLARIDATDYADSRTMIIGGDW